MNVFIITLACILWIVCAISISSRDMERIMDMSIPKLFIWFMAVALFSPLVLVYDLIKYGWYNDKQYERD